MNSFAWFIVNVACHTQTTDVKIKLWPLWFSSGIENSPLIFLIDWLFQKTRFDNRPDKTDLALDELALPFLCLSSMPSIICWFRHCSNKITLRSKKLLSLCETCTKSSKLWITLKNEDLSCYFTLKLFFRSTQAEKDGLIFFVWIFTNLQGTIWLLCSNNFTTGKSRKISEKNRN